MKQERRTAASAYARIVAYTRHATPEYSSFIAQSVHFAVSMDAGKTVIPLYHNYGKLFARCVFSNENGILSRGVRDIMMYRVGETYVITGRELQRTRLGEQVFSVQDTGMFVRWTTRDFISFSIPEVCAMRITDQETMTCSESSVFLPPAEADYMESAVSLSIPIALAEKLIERNKPVMFQSVSLPESVCVKRREELESLALTVRYTDGSIHQKRVAWNLDGVDFSSPGTYTVTGQLRARRFPFPVEQHPWADPVITWYEGKYYFIATNDANGDTSFEIRRADTPEALFAANVTRSVILSAENSGFTNTFWAPEFHIVDGKMRIFCALSVRGFDPQCYIMTLSDGGDMLNPADWSAPKRCVMPDGRNLCENPLGDGKNGITLDMTCIEASGKTVVVWSYRTWTGTDSGSMLMIAEIDPHQPWQLLTYPCLLTRPVYGWEHVDGTDNNEGPHGIVTQDKVYLFYSGGDARGQTYAIGLLTANVGSNLCDVSSWTTASAPVLASHFVPGEYGCGHHAFFTDEYGDMYITYHGSNKPGRTGIMPGIRRVHFAADGTPILHMTHEQDLPQDRASVSITVQVEP